MTPQEVQALIRRRAIEAGIDPTHAMTMASIESGFNPRAGNGGYTGLYAFGRDEWKKYGNGGDIYDPNAQFDAYVKYQNDIKNTMRGALGREPTPQELYLGWQQGAGGASSLIKGGDKPVGQLTKIDNVTANGGTPNMTGAQFANLWFSTYNDKQRKLLGQQQRWTGEGDTQESPWIGPPPNVAEAPTAVAAAPTDDRDMVGYGGSPTRLADAPKPAAKPFDYGGLLSSGLKQVAAGTGEAPPQPAWIQQAMNSPGQVHRPQMQGGLLTDIIEDPEDKKRRLMAGLLGA